MSGGVYLFFDKDGFPVDSKTVLDFDRENIVDPDLIYFSGLYYGDGSRVTMPVKTCDIIWLDSISKTPTIAECTCERFDLFNGGCKCGYLAARRAEGLE